MRMRMKPLFICFLVFLCGCGYTTKANNLPAHIKSVYIETWKNETDQPNLENELRTALIAAVQEGGELLIASADDADAVLKGRITGYSRQALRYQNDEAVQEYRLSILASFEFIDRRTEKIIVKADNFSGDTTFYLSGSSAKTETSARADALTDISRRILNKIMTLW